MLTVMKPVKIILDLPADDSKKNQRLNLTRPESQTAHTMFVVERGVLVSVFQNLTKGYTFFRGKTVIVLQMMCWASPHTGDESHAFVSPLFQPLCCVKVYRSLCPLWAADHEDADARSRAQQLEVLPSTACGVPGPCPQPWVVILTSILASFTQTLSIIINS